MPAGKCATINPTPASLGLPRVTTPGSEWLGTMCSAQLGSLPHLASTCTPALELGKQSALRGAEEPRGLRPVAPQAAHPGELVWRVLGSEGCTNPEKGRRARRRDEGGGEGMREGHRSSCCGRLGARWLPAARRPAAPGDAPGSQWMRRGVQQMASDCAVSSSSSSSSSSSCFSAEQPESQPGCQTLEWVVSRHIPPSSLGKLGARRLPEAAAAARARLVSAVALCPSWHGLMPRVPLAGRMERELPRMGAPPAQTFIARHLPSSLLPASRGTWNRSLWLWAAGMIGCWGVECLDPLIRRAGRDTPRLGHRSQAIGLNTHGVGSSLLCGEPMKGTGGSPSCSWNLKAFRSQHREFCRFFKLVE